MRAKKSATLQKLGLVLGVGAGLLFGIAALARLTVIFGAPFFVFVGGGGSYWRRALSAGLGASPCPMHPDPSAGAPSRRSGG